MPSTTAAGTGLAISAGVPATQDAAGYGALSYTEISNVESLGGFGATTEVTTFQPLRGAQQKHKGPTNFGALNPTIALEEADAGQALLTAASAPTNSALYAIRVSKPDGSLRYFQARVFGMPETIGAANSMITAAPVIEINTPVVKVAAGAPAAPVFSVQPSISPVSGSVGTTFTASDGAASNTTSYARRWLLGSTAIGTGTTVTPNGAGSLSLEVTATGPGGTKVATAAAVTVASATPTPTPGVAAPSTLVGYNATSMTPFKTALDGSADVLIWDMGPSTVAGQSAPGSKNDASFTADKQFVGAVANRTAQLLRSSGLNAGNNEWFGNHYGWGTGETAANYMTGDSRVVMAGGAAFNNTAQGGGILVSAVADTFSITFQDAVNTADIWYLDSSAGRAFRWSVDGGNETTVPMLFDGSANPATLRKVTVPLGALGTHTLKIGGNGAGVVIKAVIAKNSATREIHISNLGISGVTSAQLTTDNGTIGGRNNELAVMKPHLVILRDWQINDWRGTTINVTQSMANLQSYIDRAKAAGAAILGTTPLFDGGTNGNTATQEDYVAAVKTLYANNGIPYLDLRALYPSYAAADADGAISDNVHPSQKMNGMIATQVAQLVRYVRALQ